MIKMTKLPRRRFAAIGLCVAGLLAGGSAQAALIPGFGLGDFPSFDADSLVVAYDSDTDSLFVVGLNDVTLNLGDESAINGLDGTGFRINVSHPANRAEAAPSGTISITGEIPDLGYTSGTLLTGDIIQFGWVESGDANSPYELQLVFAVTGGDTAGLFEDGTAAIGLTQTDFPGGWDEDWVNAGQGHSLTADYQPSPVPVPGALLLFGSGLLGLARARTRKAH